MIKQAAVVEILKRSPAIWPSSGRHMLYATFDDRRVGEYKYPVYMKGGLDKDDEPLETDERLKQQQAKHKKRRRRRRIRRNARTDGAYPEDNDEDETLDYFLYPDIRSLRYPKANTANPIVTLSVIVNLDQLGNPQVKPKIRILTPPPIFQFTDDYYFTAVQWVNAGGVGGGLLNQDDDDSRSGASAAEVCVVWLNRAQNTSVTTLCKSPLWMCQETQVINAAGAGSVDGAQGIDGHDHARRRYRRNGSGPLQKSSPSETSHRSSTNKNNASSSHHQEDRQHYRWQQHQYHQQHKNGHHSRRRRAGDVEGAGYEGPRGRYGGWVDATVGGAGGGVPSTGGGVIDGTHAVVPTLASATWWSGAATPVDKENFVGDDGYTSVAGPVNAITAAGFVGAALVRKGWETGDKELTPRAPVFAVDGQGYVSVAPVRDDGNDEDDDDDVEGGVRLRRPSLKSQTRSGRYQSPVDKYYAQVVTVNITKKLLAPLTFGEVNENDDGSIGKDKKKKYGNTKSWTVVRILSWDQRTDMIYFLAVPSGRGAPHHRHLYTVKFTPVASLSATNADTSGRAAHHHQTRKPARHGVRSLPVCLSCDAGTADSAHKRERREFGGKQDRMDEARDDRLKKQQRERWEHIQEEKQDDEDEVATAEAAERRQQRNRRQKQEENRGAIRHCTYYDAQFSRDGKNYALICLGPSVPYVTLHRIVANADAADGDGGVNGDQGQGTPQNPRKQSNDSSYAYDFVALLENNTRLQDKYTNHVLLPGTRTFQLRLSGGRKLTTAGGLHFNDPLAAADYYSHGGDQEYYFPTSKGPDTDPLTVAQVRLYLPLSVYDPEADPRPEFMPNRIGNSGTSAPSKINKTSSRDSVRVAGRSSFANSRRRQSRSSFTSHENADNSGDGSKRQRRKHERPRHRRLRKLYPMLVVVNSDPGSQAITDRFSDRLGYTTGLLCSGSLGRTSASGMHPVSARYSDAEWNHRKPRIRRNRRSSDTRYYSSGYSDDYDFDQYSDSQNNEYVIAVVDPGRGTWARGYESLLALNYGDKRDGYGENMSGDRPGGLLGTSDIRDHLEAVEYLLSSATSTGSSLRDDGGGYYSEDRPRGSRLSRDRSRWSSSSPMSNRRYYSEDDDYYDAEYDDNIKNDNDDNYYYYYSNSRDYSDYAAGPKTDDDYKDDESDKGHGRDRRSASDAKSGMETLRLPYVDANRVALLGGGPTSPSTPPSVYGGYAAARMALWQTVYGGAPIEKKDDATPVDENRKEPVAIHSSYKCAITMAPVYTWRLYSSAFAERYYGFYGGKNRDTWMSYDQSDLIPSTRTLNHSLYLPSSYGKGINLLVVHGTADTIIHPQHSMLLVRGVMRQQQKYVPIDPDWSIINSTEFEEEAADVLPLRNGPIRVSQFVMADADLSNSKMATGIENEFPMEHHHQMLHSIYSHVTQYLASECFAEVDDGNRDARVNSRRSRKRRRRRWRTGNRDQENPDDQQQQEQDGDIDKNDSNDNVGGRFRRHDIVNSQQIMESKIKDGVDDLNIKARDHELRDNNKTKSINWGSSVTSNITSFNSNKKKNAIKSRKRGDDDDDDRDDEENEGEDSDDDDDDDGIIDDEDEDDDDDDDDDDEDDDVDDGKYSDEDEESDEGEDENE